MVNRSQVHRAKLLHVAALGCALSAIMAAPGAHACSVPAAGTVVQGWAMPSFDDSSAPVQSFAADTAAAPASTGSSAHANAPITGLWKVNFLAHGNSDIPDGTVIDAALATWHADGTELTNSARAPKTQSFCQGVWERTGSDTYRLNHLAMSWTPDGSAFLGPASIHETVLLSHNATLLTGTFTIDQYAADGTTVLAHITGSVVGSRVFADE